MTTVLKNLFSGKRVLVVGLGYSNVAAINFIKDLSPLSITATDLMNDPDEIEKLNGNIEKIKGIYPSCKFILGQHDAINPQDYDVAIKNPSIDEDKPIIKALRQANVPIETDVSIFFKLVPREKIVGITGTKGKSTTTTLLHLVLMEQGLKASISGNIGIPVLENVQEHLSAEVAVVELSSFMIDSLHQFHASPHIMVVTSLNQDHLDFHKTVEKYRNDKLAILRDQNEEDLAFINADSPVLLEIAHRHKPNAIFYAAKDVESFVKTKLRGRHNLSNIAAVYRVAKLVLGEKFNQELFVETVANFSPLYSRMETRGIINDIEFINNSKATDTDAFCFDLSTLISEKKSVYVLCGGEDKGLELQEMALLLGEPEVKSIAIFDNVGGRRLSTLLPQEKICGYYLDVEHAFSDVLKKIEQNITKNNAVILMPGTGTYGIFKNKHGSDTFNRCVDELTT